MEPKLALLAAIRQQVWAITPEYLAAIEALAMRAYEHPALMQVAVDGHQARLSAHLEAVAAVGTRLDGTSTATVRDGVAVLPVFGPIFPRASMISASTDGTSLDVLMRDFRAAQASSAVDRVVMYFDTPGGTASGLAEAAGAIRAAVKPVTAFVGGMAASAGYWLAAQASEIVTEPAGILGSIGVAMSSEKQVQPDADGRMTVAMVSSGAPYKLPDLDTDDGRASRQQLLDAAEAVFHADVAKGRKVSVATVRNDFGRGGVMLGADAVAAGLADRIGTLESVLKGSRAGARVNVGRSRATAAAQVQARRVAASIGE